MYKRKANLLKIAVISAALIFLAVNSRTIANVVRVKCTEMYAPILRFTHSTSKTFEGILPCSDLRKENLILQKKIELLSRKLEEDRVVHDENRRLKNLLNFKKTIPFDTVSAQVIGRDPSNWSNSVIVDKGAYHGIKPSRAVLSTRGLVGRVLEVGKYSSKILLLSDPNSRVGVFIQRNRQGGVLVGRPDNKCKMIYISLDSDVAKGDKVFTAGFGSIFPKDILVGEVLKVEREPGTLYKSAIIRTSQDMSKLEEVLCIK